MFKLRWLLLMIGLKVSAQSMVAEGHFADIAADSRDNLHLVYGRDAVLYYRFYDADLQEWGDEVNPAGLRIQSGDWGIKRSDPDIVIDSHNYPHVFAGSEYAYWTGSRWVSVRPHIKDLRDTELAIDAKDTVYLIHRGGNTGGFLGLLKRHSNTDVWTVMNDPDTGVEGKNDHVYGDMAVAPDQSLWIIQRHASPRKVSCHISRKLQSIEAMRFIAAAGAVSTIFACKGPGLA